MHDTLTGYLDNASGKQVEEGVLTIGTLGHPNVGKSSLINSLCGKKVVSVSRYESEFFNP